MNSAPVVSSHPSGAESPPGSRSWRAVAGLALCVCTLLSVSVYSFIILLSSLAADVGFSATQAGGVVSAMWLAAPFALICAPLIKAIGPWRLVAMGVLVQAACFFMLPHVNDFWQLYLLRLLMGLGKIITMTSAPVLVASYCERRFGLAMSIIWAAGVGGGFVFAPLTNLLVQDLGWRGASTALGAIIVATLGLAGLLARSAGPLTRPAEARIDSLAHKHGNAWREVALVLGPVRSLLCALAIVGAGMASIAAYSHQIAYFERAGLTAPFGAFAYVFLSIGAMLGALAAGWLLDRFPAVWAAAIVGVTIFTGLALYGALLAEPSHAIAITAVLCIGFGLGGGELLWINLLRLRVPEAIFSTAYGGWYFSLQIGYAAGGAVGGLMLDQFGADGFALTLCLMYLLPAIMSISLARHRPQCP